MNKDNSKTSILIVGAGISGATLASKFATETNYKITVIDAKEHIGGNCYDYRDEETGITVHKYGAHIFHSSSLEAYEYLCQYTEFTNYQHKVKARIQGKEVPIPFNFNSIDILFDSDKAQHLKKTLLAHYELNSKVPILELRKTDDEELRQLAEFIYRNVFLYYTLKQWGLKPNELDKSISGRVPIYVGTDNRYFPWDKYQGIPNSGYTAMIRNMLNHPRITLKLKTKYNDILASRYDHVFYTGTIDGFFNYKYGKLSYRSERFETEIIDSKYFQSNSVINYPNADHEFTRIIEHKYFLNEQTKKTFISYEYPEAYEIGYNEPYYPVSTAENQSLYKKYLEEAKTLMNIHFLGRLGDYRYYDMDQAVLRALNVFNEIMQDK